MQKMRILGNRAAIVALCLTSASCLVRIAPDKLAGKYVRASSYVNETLELTANGQYTHVFKLSGQIIRNTGSWELMDDPGYLVFKDFQSPEDPKPVTIGYPAMRSLDGVIKIGLEQFHCFYKQ
jgi:hypothetical protein